MLDTQRAATLREEIKVEREVQERLKLDSDAAKAAYDKLMLVVPVRNRDGEIVGYKSAEEAERQAAGEVMTRAWTKYRTSVERVEALRVELRRAQQPTAADLDEAEQELRDLVAQDETFLAAFLEAFVALRRLCQEYNYHITRKAKLSALLGKYGRAKWQHGSMRKIDYNLFRWLFAETSEANVLKRVGNLLRGVPFAHIAPLPNFSTPDYKKFERRLD